MVDTAVEEMNRVRPYELAHRAPLPRLHRERRARAVRDLQLMDGDVPRAQVHDRGGVVLHPVHQDRTLGLTHWGRQELVRRIEAGTPIAHVAEAMNVSRPTAHKWWARYQADPTGSWWSDRSSSPHRSPTRTPRKVEKRIASLRRNRKLGPARIAGQVGLPASTVHAVLCRQGTNQLRWLDRPTGTKIRRYVHDRPGDLVHVDIKKLGKIPPGGGWRAHGRSTDMRRARTKRGPASATRSCTPRSMTTADSRTARSTTTRKPSPASCSGSGPRRSTKPTASPCVES